MEVLDMKKYKIDEQHEILVTEDKEYACYQVEVIEYSSNKVTKRNDGRYSGERLEEVYGIAL